MEIFNVKNLSFKYPNATDFSLDNINFTLNSGEILLLCGSSGCGKSTLLNHLKTVMTPFGEVSGEVLYCGKNLAEIDLKTQNSEIGYVFQDPSRQQVTDTVWHEMAFGLENMGVERNIMKRRISETANFFGIDKWFRREIRTLSGGQKQLVNLASIMVMAPDVLILDEPTASLDPVAANEFLNSLYRINEELGTTIIIAEHRTEQIMPHRHKVMFMENGKVVFCAPVKNIPINQQFIKYLPVPAQVAHSLSADFIPMDIASGRKWLGEYTSSFKNKTNAYTVAAASQNNKVVLKNVCFRYSKDGADILKNCNIEVPEGCIYAVVGGNGSGKSTLLKTIAGIYKPYYGKVQLNDSTAVYMPQDARLMFSQDSVLKELQEMTSDAEAVKTIAKQCHIDSLLDRHPYDISVGQAQRVALAKLLLTGADILLLDEITRGIDPDFKTELGGMLKNIVKSGKTIVLVSHDLEFCAKYADIVGMFFDCEICAQDDKHSFFQDNNFYTTQGARLSRGILDNCITAEDIISVCKKQ